MTSFIDVRVLGGKELQRSLDRFTEELQKKIARHALKAGANHIKSIAEGIVPTDTGRLRQSLKVRAFTRKHARTGASLMGFVVQPGTREELGIAPDDPYYYPSVLEYGAVGGKYRAPQPFLRPAYDQGKRGADQIMLRAFRDGVERTANKLARQGMSGINRAQAMGQSAIRSLLG